MTRIFRDFFTAPDNIHYELGRALWAVAVFALIAGQVAAIAEGQAFDPATRRVVR